MVAGSHPDADTFRHRPDAHQTLHILSDVPVQRLRASPHLRRTATVGRISPDQHRKTRNRYLPDIEIVTNPAPGVRYPAAAY